jgi:DNA-binding transcriptional ArsR family regulator
LVDEVTCCRYEDFIKALADETRQAVLELLQGREMNVGEIVACFDQTQPTISYYLGLLRRAGLAVARREGQQVYYTINRCCLEKCTRRLVEPFV